jgi:hypothetical protein
MPDDHGSMSKTSGCQSCHCEEVGIVGVNHVGSDAGDEPFQVPCAPRVDLSRIRMEENIESDLGGSILERAARPSDDPLAVTPLAQS